jgi:hypothetical protein
MVDDTAKATTPAAPPGPPLQPPGGGGTFDGMLEARVARLEADVGHIQRDVVEIKDAIKAVGRDLTDLKIANATTSERMAHLLTYGQSFTMLATMLALIGGLVIFQGQIQKFAGIAPAPPSANPSLAN